MENALENTLKNNNLLSEILIPLLQQMSLPSDYIPLVYHAIAIALIAIVAKISHLIAKSLLTTKLNKIIMKTAVQWDDLLQNNRFFINLAHAIPAILITPLTTQYIQHETLSALLHSGASIYLIVAMTGAGFSVMSTAKQSYSQSNLAQRIPIDGFVQVGKLILAVIALLLIVSVVLDKSPALLLSGLGAIAAILMLVFRDTILGLVAGINIVANRMVNNGDWISMPKYGADGNVLGLGLTTVKIQNWDKTISTVPTYALMTDAVKNWRGMEQSGGRRIKRAMAIDAQSLKIASAELKQSLNDAELDISPPFAETIAPEQTNLGLWRNYMYNYLRAHPMINNELTLLVRQLEPTATGIPVEIYCFSKDKRWANYESLQAELIEHFIALMPQFELRGFQHVSDNSLLANIK